MDEMKPVEMEARLTFVVRFTEGRARSVLVLGQGGNLSDDTNLMVPDPGRALAAAGVWLHRQFSKGAPVSEPAPTLEQRVAALEERNRNR